MYSQAARTDLFLPLKDELVFVQQLLDVAFAFGLVVGKVVF
jgi:hypothetical protein